MKTWFITGISRGLGLAVAKAALERGDKVIGTVRSGRPPLVDGSGALHVMTLDMADAAAIGRAVNAAFALGRVDILVNNAGFGLLGAVEDASDADVETLFTVDVFGPFRLIRAALPHLRAQGSGHILNITSIAGRAAGAGSGLYAAAKHALESLSASLAQEVAPLGLNVTAVAPGAFRTDFLSPHSVRRSQAVVSDYDASAGRMGRAFDAMAGRQLGDPALAAAALLKIVDCATPPTQLLLKSDALARTRRKLETMANEIDQWLDLTKSTDFDDLG